MIVEAYSMDVYCDMPECVRNKKPELIHERGHDDFSGINKRECDKQRVSHGWRKIAGQDVCPQCIEELKKPRQPTAD